MTGSDPQGPHSAAARLLTAYARGERIFMRVNLAGTDLHNANLQGCNFFGADFTGADLSGADLSGANLGYARLTSANLSGANLSGAHLDQTDFTNANTTNLVTDPPSPPPPPPPAQPEAHAPSLTVESHVSAEPYFCINCHTPLPAGANFCPTCGTARSVLPTSPSPAPAAQPPSPPQPQPFAPPPPQPAPNSTQLAARPTTIPLSSMAKADPKKPNTPLLVAAIAALLVGEAWQLIVRAAVVILVIVGIGAFISSCIANATLNEHSSCQQFEQADANAQTKVLQDMMAAHHDTENIQTIRFSVQLYCGIYGGSAPIDGIYSGGSTSHQPPQALRRSAPLELVADPRSARSPSAVG